jgi:hypothetical protein
MDLAHDQLPAFVRADALFALALQIPAVQDHAKNT